MRILLVEDNQEKLRRVLNVLVEVPGCAMEDITVARDAIEAKSRFKESSYDLAILDIALPERADKMPSPEGGISLLEEILERDIYNKPREVVGLTAFDDVLDNAAARFGDDLWQVMKYDAASSEWQEALQRKVRHILLAQKAGKELSYDYDLCVITALHDPELTAVLHLPWKWEALEISGDSGHYHRGEYVRNDEVRRVVAAASSRMGMPAAAVLATKMIYTFRPRYLVMCGIAAGVRGTCEIGDVVAPDSCWDWGSGKLLASGGKTVLAATPHQLQINTFIRAKIGVMAENHGIWDEIRHNWQAKTPATTLSVRVGPLASGAAVLASGKYSETLKLQHRKLMAIDMEAYAVFAAADEAPLQQPKAFALKGICDFADEQKADDFQPYAAYASANALRVLVEQYL